MKGERIFIVALMLGAALAVFSDDYIDDVYYWDSPALSSPTVNRDATETLPSGNEPQNKVQVIFIEDSITQHSDTIVKAIIRR